MNTLPLALSPRETSNESNKFRRIESEGFIDEQVVSRIIARGTYDRTIIQPAGVALSANADDYAGWMLPVRSPSQGMADASPQRLPEPPALSKMAEPGIETPYQGGHRWWLFGISGAMTCGILAFKLFSAVPLHETADLAIAPAPDKGEIPAASTEKQDYPPSFTKVVPKER